MGRRARLVHRDHGVAETADAGAVPERLVDRHPERESGVLDRVVRSRLEGACAGVHARLEQDARAGWIDWLKERLA